MTCISHYFLSGTYQSYGKLAIKSVVLAYVLASLCCVTAVLARHCEHSVLDQLSPTDQYVNRINKAHHYLYLYQDATASEQSEEKGIPIKGTSAGPKAPDAAGSAPSALGTKLQIHCQAPSHKGLSKYCS